MAVSAIAIGLLTFFAPIVILDPPVMNRREWSPWHLASAVFERKLPVPGGLFDPGLVEIALIYLLMAVALALVFRPGPPKALAAVSAVGVVLSLLGKFWDLAFLWAFGWYHHMQTQHLRMGVTYWVLPWIMPALLVLCFAKELDAE